MPAKSFALPIRVGVVAGEPIRLEGLTSVFEREPDLASLRLLPVIGSLEELMADQELEYLVDRPELSARGDRNPRRDSPAAPGLAARS